MNSAQEIINEDIESVIERLGTKINLLEGKTILITGSNGLLGSYLVDTIKIANDTIFKKSAKVIGINRSKIKPGSRNHYLQKDKNFKFLSHDASIPIKGLPKIDYIVHSAGTSSPAVFQKFPLNTIDVNVNGIRWLLDLGKKKKVKSVLYFSSGEVYGSPDPEHVPTPETYNGNSSTMSNRACYIESKRLAETICNIYWQQYQIPVKVARPFVIYGPGVTTEDGKVLSDFMKFTLSGKPIQMLSEGHDLRSDCYIADATVAFWEILLSDYNGEVFNVGNDKEEFTIRELAQKLHAMCDIDSPPMYKGKKVPAHLRNAPKRFIPDLTKLREMLKFNPEISLVDGLSKTLEWNRRMLGKK